MRRRGKVSILDGHNGIKLVFPTDKNLLASIDPIKRMSHLTSEISY